MRILQPHRHAAVLQVLLRLPDSVFPEVKDRRRKRRVGLALGETLIDVFEVPDAA